MARSSMVHFAVVWLLLIIGSSNDLCEGVM